MRVLLVRPPVPRYTIGLKHIMICEPLELEYVAAGLPNHDVQIMDMILERNLEKRLRAFRPDVVGTSCYITGVNEVKKLCRKVKRWNHECFTVVGGVHAARAPEDFVDSSVDCIVRGDGTTILAEVLDAVAGNSPLERIPGLCLPGPNYEFIDTGNRPYMPPADSLPLPRRDLVQHLSDQYYYLLHQPVATIKTTWGCWYECNFCYTWRITDGQVYARSPQSIVDELEQIEAEDIYIVDDIFLMKPTRLAAIASLLRERNIRKKYLAYARADFVAENEEIIREWSELGLRAVFIGLEASTDAELYSMNKQCTVDYNRIAVEVLRRNGVDTYGSLIPQPDYLPKDWERLWNFIEETGLYYVNISPLTPLPGTVIWREYEQHLTVRREAHGLWDLSHCLLPTRMSLKAYYRSLLRVYARTILNIRRSNRLTLRTRPPVLSLRYLRLWLGAVKIMFQFLNAHRHHTSRALRQAMDSGPALSGALFRSAVRPTHKKNEVKPVTEVAK